MAERRTVRIPVDGGTLAVELGEGGRPAVLAVHGVASNCRLWNWLALETPGVSLVTPDLRGRAGSYPVGGPSSIRQHAEDLVRVLDALELSRVPVCGMSMGGFVAVELAVRRPDRVQALVLVDGGFPVAVAPGLTPEEVPAAFAAQLARVSRRWEGVEQYLAYFAAANPLLDARDPLLRDHLEHDLADGRVLLDREAVLADATDVLFGEHRWRELTVPIEFVYAEWGSGPGTPPAYSASALAEFRAVLPTLGRPRRISGADHAATVMTRAGAAVVGAALHDVMMRCPG